MKVQIRRFSPVQTAKVLGLIYVLAAMIVTPLFIFAATMSPEAFPGGVAFALLLPALYGIVGFVAVLIGTAFYNFVAARVGGIEVELSEDVTSAVI